MTGEGAGPAQRRTFVAVLDLVRLGRPLAPFLGSGVDADRVMRLLRPVARADAVIEWIGVNGERVDAMLTAGESQWRIIFGSASESTIDWIDVYRRPDHADGVVGGRAVVINGPSGAGKSTLMRAMQQLATVPLVIFDEPEHVGAVQEEYLIWRDRAPALHRGYLHAIAALARAGNTVALAAAGHPQSEVVEAFGDVPMYSVGLSCELEVLVERERRSRRWGGIATESLAVHDGWTYDVEFDTTAGRVTSVPGTAVTPDPLAMAQQVLDNLELRGS